MHMSNSISSIEWLFLCYFEVQVFEVYMSMVNHALNMVTDAIRMLIKDQNEVMKETNPDSY